MYIVALQWLSMLCSDARHCAVRLLELTAGHTDAASLHALSPDTDAMFRTVFVQAGAWLEVKGWLKVDKYPWKACAAADTRRPYAERVDIACEVERLGSCSPKSLDPLCIRRLVDTLDRTAPAGQFAWNHVYIRILQKIAAVWQGQTLDIECLHAALRAITHGRDDMSHCRLAARALCNQFQRAAKEVHHATTEATFTRLPRQLCLTDGQARYARQPLLCFSNERRAVLASMGECPKLTKDYWAYIKAEYAALSEEDIGQTLRQCETVSKILARR